MNEKSKMSILPLQKGILYGPVNSRRLGKSLGINLMPTKYKLCSFNCVYCHYGTTDKLTMDSGDYLKDFPDFDAVVKIVQQTVKSSLEFDYITFSGNGEPTLHPEFSQLVDEVVKMRDRYKPKAKIALLSNSTGLIYDKIRESIKKIDLPVFKLDVGREEKFKAINRPYGDVNLGEIVGLLSNLSNICIQTILIDGNLCNISKEDLDAYFEKLKKIQPGEVHIYSTDRPVSNTEIKRVIPEKLEEIAKEGQGKTGVRIKAFYL